MTIDAAVQDVLDTVRAISGIRSAPPYVPDKPPAGTFAIAYAFNGNQELNTTAERKSINTIVVEVLKPYKDLARDLETMAAFVDSVPNALMGDITLGETADLFTNIRYEFLRENYAGLEVIGYRFYVEGVKIRTTIT